MASTVLKAKLRFKHSLVGGSLVTHGVAASAARERGVVSLASARRIRNTTSRKRADEASMQLQGREDKSAKVNVDMGKGITLQGDKAKLRRLQAGIVPMAQQIGEVCMMRRILVQARQKTEEECHFLLRMLSERTTLWREPFWALLSLSERYDLCQSMKMYMTDSGEQMVCRNTVLGSSMLLLIEGSASVGAQHRREVVFFEPMETFGFMRLPGDDLGSLANDAVQRVAGNRNSRAYRGGHDYHLRREKVTDMQHLSIKFLPKSSWISISSDKVQPVLRGIAVQHQLSSILKSLGLNERLILGGGGKPLFKSKSFCAGHMLISEGDPPSYVYIIVAGECRLVRGVSACSRGRARRKRRDQAGGPQRVNMLLSSGFATSLDMSQLGLLGAKSLVGDIPVLLGGRQPASVICHSSVHALQARADKFLDLLNVSSMSNVKQAYCASAGERLLRIQARGGDVDELTLLAADNTALVVEISQRTDCQENGHEPRPAREPKSSHGAPLVQRSEDVAWAPLDSVGLERAKQTLAEAPSLPTFGGLAAEEMGGLSLILSSCARKCSLKSSLQPPPSPKLELFPTFTRRRDLHAHSQPILPHLKELRDPFMRQQQQHETACGVDKRIQRSEQEAIAARIQECLPVSVRAIDAHMSPPVIGSLMHSTTSSILL